MTSTTAPSVARPERRLVHLDVLRCAAILLVIGHHPPMPLLPSHYGRYFFSFWHHVGWQGVDLFFVLSGFLIGGLLFAEIKRTEALDVRRFLLRRAFKIWPPYLAFLLLVGAWLVTRPTAPSFRVVAWRLAPCFGHVQNYFWSRIPGDLMHLWSLAVEEHFYLLLPCLLTALLAVPRAAGSNPVRWFPPVGAALVLACLGVRVRTYLVIGHFDLQWLYTATHVRLDSLLIGVVLAYGVTWHADLLRRGDRHRRLLVACGVGAFLPAAVIARTSGPFICTVGYTLTALGAACLVWWSWLADAVVAPPATPRLVAAAARVGTLSYGIYLFHVPFGQEAARRVSAVLPFALGRADYAVALALALLASVAFGALTARLIERPALALRDRLYPSRGARPPAPAPR